MSAEKTVCPICPHHCALGQGQVGRCRARMAFDGQIVCLNYGHLASLALDPVEKKPFARWYPGKFILSTGSFGCNLACPFCQNHAISQVGAELPTEIYNPRELLDRARALTDRGNIGIAFTYNEPLIGFEFVRDTARLFRAAGLKTALVTNGMAEPEKLAELLPVIDALNIDLKGWHQEFYDWIGGDLATVKANIEQAAAVSHVEVTTLVLPGKNDSERDMEEEAAWLATLSPELPLHISRYYPRYHTPDIPATPVETIYHLADVARRHLKYVYEGNV